MSDFVENLKKGQSLSIEESKALFNELMEGKYNENSIIEILESLVKKGETKDELAGGIFVLREKATKVKVEQYRYLRNRRRRAKLFKYFYCCSYSFSEYGCKSC